ncbi:MAG: hypothetical protein IPH93_02485 [Saprospiraceae bacterium]|nr:hypothetical protein [Saprospiraceae bacterium]
MDKEIFLRTIFVDKLRNVDPNSLGLWGKMNVHQMAEHMVLAFKTANGKIKVEEIITPPEKIQRSQEFILSDIPFKENTKNVLLPAEPFPIRNANYQEVLDKLEAEIAEMFRVYDEKPDLKLRNPIFGDIDRNLQIHLLHKHATHHLKQFGLL